MASSQMALIRRTASVAAGSRDGARIGRYEILNRVGVGGMAEIFRARAVGPRSHEGDVIIKRILPVFAAQPEFVRSFADEARILSMLVHPNVVGIYDFGEADGYHYLALEYLDGPSLASILARAKKAKQKLPVGVAAFIAREICRGLAAVHSLCDAAGRCLNVVHRDVTPSNVMTTTKGTVKLLDFGIAKMAGQNITRVGHIKGKSGYLAPEQILGGAVDGRADLFALGIALYEMLSLEPLFFGEGGDIGTAHRTLEKVIVPPATFRQDVPHAFSASVMKALAREPHRRYQSAVEMEADMDRAMLVSGWTEADVAEALAAIRQLPAD